MAVIETPVLLISKNESGERRLCYPITRADCVDGLEELVDEKVVDAKNVSWNNIIDKPFGDNEDGSVTQLDNKYLGILEQSGGLVHLCPTVTGTTVFNTHWNAYQLAVAVTAEMYDKWVNNVHTVRVIYDGTVYNCDPQQLDGFVGVGNCTMVGGTSNNEPFVLGLTDEGNGIYYCVCFSTVDTAPAEHTLSVAINDPTLYKLKEEYRPDIPHFNLIEMGLSDPSDDEDNQAILPVDTTEIRAALERGSVKITFTYNGLVHTEVANGLQRGEDKVMLCGFMVSEEPDVRFWLLISETIIIAKVITYHKLPDVSTEDNGKILSVDNGAWAAMDASSSLPEVTEADDGKVLSVKNGVWAATEAPAGEGGSVSTETDILAEGEFNFSPNSDAGTLYIGMLASAEDNPISLTEGETYQVVWDGTEYTCVASTQTLGVDTGIALGNLGLLGIGATTDEPFIIGASGGSAVCYTSSTELTHTVRIYQKTGLKVSWENVTDKPFEENQVDTDIFAKQTIDGFAYSDSWYAYTPGEVTPAQFVLVSGSTYFVEWDGTVYTCEAYAYEYGGYSIVAIGNGTKLGQPANDEPFLVTYNITANNTQFFSDSESASHTVHIYTIENIIKYLDNKYLSILEKTKSEEIEILPETSVTFIDGQANPDFVSVLVSGATVRVIWDGTEYVLIAKEATLDGMKLIVAGNESLGGLGGEDTGEPFAVGHIDAVGMSVIVIQSIEESIHTVQIYQLQPDTYMLKEEHLGNVDYETKVINKPFGQLAEAGAIVTDHNSLYDADFGFLLTDFNTYESYVDNAVLMEGATYSVEIAGVTYDGVGATVETIKQSIQSLENTEISGDGILIYQDGNLWGAMAVVQNIVWFIVPNSMESYTVGEYYQVKITVVEAVKKIDVKYLPMDAIKAYIDEHIDEVLKGKY